MKHRTLFMLILNATLILYNTTSIANLEQAAAHTRALIREESQMSMGAVGRPIQKITSLLGGCSHTAAKFLAQQAGVFIDSFTVLPGACADLDSSMETFPKLRSTYCGSKTSLFTGRRVENVMHCARGLSNSRNTQCYAGMQHSSKCISKSVARNVKFVEQIHSKAS